MGLKARLRQGIRRRIGAPEPQPVRLGQRRIYVLPTPAGLALLLTLLAMLVASINYNLSLGYGLVFLLGSVFVVHILHTWRTLTGLRVRVTPQGECFAGQAASWRLSLENDGRHERPALRLLDESGALLASADAAPGSRTETRFTRPAPQRGPLQPGFLTLESTQPLGWIRAWSYLEPDAPVCVFPAPEGALPIPQGFAASQTGTHRASQPGQDDFAGLRTHQASDSLRHVAWKQLAQGRGWLTKQYDSTSTPDCILDWRQLPATLDTEQRLSQLCVWVLATRQAGTRTTLILPEGQTGPGDDAAHHQACLTRLALSGTKAQR